MVDPSLEEAVSIALPTFPFSYFYFILLKYQTPRVEFAKKIRISLFSFTYPKTTGDIFLVLLDAKVEVLGYA